MNLERLIAALGPAEVVNVAGATGSGRDRRPRLRRAHGRPGALFFCVRGRSADGHDFAPAAAERGAAALVVEHAAAAARCRSSSSPTSARRCRAAAALFFGEPSAELDGRGGHRHEREDDDRVPAARDPRGGRPPERPADEHRAPRRRRAAARPASTRPRRSTCSGCCARWSTAGDTRLRARGDLGGAGAGPARGDALRRARLHEPDPRPPRTSTARWRRTSRPRRRSSPRPSAPSSTSATRTAAPARGGLPDAVTFDADSDALAGIELKLRGALQPRERDRRRARRARRSGSSDEAIRRGIESVAGVPGRFESIDEGQAVHRHRRLRAHPGGARATSSREARAARRRPADGRLRRRRRPRPRQAAADGARPSPRSPTAAILTSDNPRCEDPDGDRRRGRRRRATGLEVELDRRAAIELRARRGRAPGDVVVDRRARRRARAGARRRQGGPSTTARSPARRCAR